MMIVVEGYESVRRGKKENARGARERQGWRGFGSTSRASTLVLESLGVTVNILDFNLPEALLD